MRNIPDTLLIAVDDTFTADIQCWWNELTTAQQNDFLEIAHFEPETIAAPFDSNVEESETNEWFEYIVNQDLRFYFDRSDPPENPGQHQLVYPIIRPISCAADVKVVSHLLYSPRRNQP